jgi:hypothetical protein
VFVDADAHRYFEQNMESDPEKSTEIISVTSPAEEEAQSVAAPEKSRGRFIRNVGRLKPLLPYLTGGLRMIDHGAAQIVAQLLNLAANGNPVSEEAHSEIQQELAEIEASHRDLRLSVQDHSVELKRFEDQIVLLRQTVERNASEHAEVAEEVSSLRKLVLGIGMGLGVLLVVLIVLAGLLLAQR